MKRVIAELDYEVLTSEWALQPVFWINEGEERHSPSVVIHLFHCHPDAQKNWEYCSLANREGFQAGAMPQYMCNKCAERAPSTITEEKLLALKKHEGYDPLNDRKSAVLATKNKRKA